MKSHSVMQCYLADARIAELEAENGKLRESLLTADKIAAEAVSAEKAAKAENARLRYALEYLEYVPVAAEGMEGFSHCPWCERFSDDPHANNCARQLALGKELPQICHTVACELKDEPKTTSIEITLAGIADNGE